MLISGALASGLTTMPTADTPAAYAEAGPVLDALAAEVGESAGAGGKVTVIRVAIGPAGVCLLKHRLAVNVTARHSPGVVC